jgi:CheY-like chemotaxis protein
LRGDPRLAELPCIALSADGEAAQRAAAAQAGFADYWLKPIEVPQLAEALLRMQQP